MAKKTFFFSHDANARNDEKILAVRMEHGMEGYGIYFAIIEKLLESTNYILLKDYNMIAFELRVSAKDVKSIVEKFGLFDFTECGKLFYSKSLIDRMDILEEKRGKRSEAGRKGAESRWKNREKMANAIKNDSNAIAMPSKKMAEYSIVKYSKENKSPPREEMQEEGDFFDLIVPPDDGVARNWESLKGHLKGYGGSESDLKKIAVLSDYGKIGHPIWTLIPQIRDSKGAITQPVKFILSRIGSKRWEK